MEAPWVRCLWVLVSPTLWMFDLDKKVFYDFIRNLPFGGKISPDQFDGIEKILAYQELNHPDMDDRWLAYILATVFHETARTMQPIREQDNKNKTYLKSKKYYPYYGRGLIQITWKENYEKYGIEKPDDALTWPIALYVLFHGMIEGEFRKDKIGKVGLRRYFNTKVDNPTMARLIVNGYRTVDGQKEDLPDKASLIAQYHKNFLDAITQAKKAVDKPEEVRNPAPKSDEPNKPSLTADPITQVVTGVGGVGIITQLIAAVSNPWAFGAVGLIILGLGVFYFLRNKQANATGV